MLHKITAFEKTDQRKLMDLYQEGNLENAAYFYPDMDKEIAVQKCEADFLRFLETDFFAREGSEYWILETDGIWVSALRLNKIEENFYYLEALETHPDFRKRGLATCLLSGVLENLKQRGPFRLCDSVSKANTASLKTHLKCGFEIISETAVNYLYNDTDDDSYQMQYSYSAENTVERRLL